MALKMRLIVMYLYLFTSSLISAFGETGTPQTRNVSLGLVSGTTINSSVSFSNLSAGKSTPQISETNISLSDINSTAPAMVTGVQTKNVSFLTNKSSLRNRIMSSTEKSTSTESFTLIRQMTTQNNSVRTVSQSTNVLKHINDSENATLSTLPVIELSTQMTNATILLPVTDTLLNSTDITDFNSPSKTNIYTTAKQNVPLTNRTTLKKKPTTDPFNDNRPWNIRRSSHPPREHSRTTTELNSDYYDKGDTFWPVAIALTIGIPTIIVFAVTITVLYRRRMNKPRGLLGLYGTDYQAM